ncbi:calcium-transporting P-type ATPase, PMR1-type [Desulfosporosinus sp.]|uniref:calcium-transporting P-type ATPase, PMR1-type n=1 Tax=Desulfosporosinus sp. TaxID=157907 RepID=UPI00230EAC0A|nr:calcium-transporting P-type ATPase, PMR1-type [Desulfosporosinus sp.]MCO5384853.1 calcium-transporting P-type ATPase, PMR1-type [Desulfosporosinus sp.]MDA8220182.1 calcium-transporting P-type ATPase, PMR1-type [Desulfitobacterium hafniense]
MWFNKSTEAVVEEFKVNLTTGLSENEVIQRREKHGLNELTSKKPKTLLRIFLSQLNNIMIYILIGAALISGFIGEISDAVIIGIVILINAIVGVIQESKAEKALDALKKLSTPKALVKRDGESREIPSQEVVSGDLVIIDAGRYIPCDLRLIETANLQIEESALTGESVPSDKQANLIIEAEDTPLGDQKNMAFMSTLATYGRGAGIAVATGMDTQIGKIATMLEESTDEQTPLQKKIEELGKILGLAAIGICALMFLVGVLQDRDLYEMFLIALSLAVAAIPEGLPAIVTIVLAMGVQRLIKEHAIVRKLPAVETLGSVSVICSDKTGTLTQNKMTVTHFFANDEQGEITSIDLNKEAHRLLLENLVLCNDSTYSETAKTGDPTEIALLEAGNRFDLSKDLLQKTYPRVHEIPFDSDRKLMTTVHNSNNQFIVFTKGALDSLLKISTDAYINGETVTLTEELKNKIIEASNKMSDDALRVLGAAYKSLAADPSKEGDKIEENLTFIGLVGMIDPPRLEVKDSIALCKKAGIKTVMITGDHKNTAFAIANELGISNNIEEVMSGSELDKLTQDQLNDKIEGLSVFARVSPEHKVTIVKAIRSRGNIVSMTGDGVNDAPSLKAADIGVAMGITGTDVAKGAADIVLTDDNFSTIVSAIKEGRNIFNNIKKSIIFLLSCNLGEVVALFLAILLGWASPLRPIHILWVNLVTDTLPALSLGVDSGDPTVMDKKPRDPKATLFAEGAGLRLISNGALIGILTLTAFVIGNNLYPDSLMHAQTMAFVVLSISQLFHSLNMRHPDKSIFELGVFTNKNLVYSILLGILLQVIVITVPALASVFKVYPLTIRDWAFVLLLSVMPLVINEIIKAIRRNKISGKTV